MKTDLKPANSKVQALAERGIDGERISAQKKIARLNAGFDFTAPDPTETRGLFWTAPDGAPIR
jgi:hypothetical protein